MVQATDITDLANSVISKYGRNALTDAATALQRYTAAERLLNKKRMKMDGGDQYKFTLLYQGDGNARAIGFFEADNLDQVDGTVQGTIPWRFLETGCHFDVKQISVNSGADRIYNFLMEKEYQMWISYWEMVESYFWGGPASSTDEKIPFGLLKYWLDYDATEGFNGGNHTSFSSGQAGISSSTYDNWNHWTANYAAITDADLVKKMRKAYRRTDFRGIPNKPIKSYEDGVGHNCGIYTTDDTLMSLEELLDTKNDNVKNELAKYDGVTMFRRTPVEWVPWLQENRATSDPVIGLDWNDFKCVALKGEWMRQTPYHRSGTQHEVRQRFVNSSMNFVMHNKRKHFMIAKADPLSS